MFEPDLIILDEFQRFRNLLQTGDTKDEAAQLAQRLFESAGSKILLLSATPYKMYTVSAETDGDDHYRDFLETSRFLLAKKPEDVDRLEKSLVTYRKALCGQDIGIPVQDALHAIEQCLRKVMCRTERLASTADRNGMLKEVQTPLVPMVPEDFLEYRLLSKLARQVKADDPIELWKSSPYLINIMEETYRLKSLLHEAIESQDQPVIAALRDLLPWQLPAKAMEAYQPIDPKNPRLRTLIDDLAQSQLWKLLWLPADLPYYEAQGAFAGTDDHPHTKQLIFSSWKVVPRSIAMLVSYAMERLMVLEGDAEPSLQRTAGKARAAAAVVGRGWAPWRNAAARPILSLHDAGQADRPACAGAGAKRAADEGRVGPARRARKCRTCFHRLRAAMRTKARGRTSAGTGRRRFCSTSITPHRFANG